MFFTLNTTEELSDTPSQQKAHCWVQELQQREGREVVTFDTPDISKLPGKKIRNQCAQKIRLS